MTHNITNGSQDEPNIVFTPKSQWISQPGTKNVKTYNLTTRTTLRQVKTTESNSGAPAG